VSGAPLLARPAELSDGDRADVVDFAAAARRSHDWAVGGAVGAAAGVGRADCGWCLGITVQTPATVEDLLAAAGWVAAPTGSVRWSPAARAATAAAGQGEPDERPPLPFKPGAD